MNIAHPTGGKGTPFNPFYRSAPIYPLAPDGTRPHMGLDFLGSLGMPILSVLPGVVIEARTAPPYPAHCGFGTRVIIEHDAPFQNAFAKMIRAIAGKPRKIKSLYAHCDSLNVNVGDVVDAGQVIATMGSTGVGGVHLHFGVILPEKPDDRQWVYTKETCGNASGYCVDPMAFLLEFYVDNPIYTGLVVAGIGVNVRSGAGTSYPDIGGYPKDTELPIIATQEDDTYLWVQWASLDGSERWSASEKLSNGDVYVELTPIEVPEPPIPEPPDDCEEMCERCKIIGQKEVKAAIEEVLSNF